METKYGRLVSDKIRLIRLEKKMTLEEAAVIIGINRDSLCRYENNKVDIKLSTLCKILTGYKYDYKIFFGEIYDKMQ